MSNLYNVIAQLCKTKGISGYRLCREIGIQPSILTDLKVGRKQSLSAETLSKIAAHFGVSVDYLLGMEESDWSFAFRRNLLEAMGAYDSFDYAEAGVDQNWLYAVANGDIPLTFKTACDVADVLGESFDSLLGRDYINQANESKKPLVNGDEELTEYLEENDLLYDWIDEVGEPEIDRAINQLQVFTVAQRLGTGNMAINQRQSFGEPGEILALDDRVSDRHVL